MKNIKVVALVLVIFNFSTSCCTLKDCFCPRAEINIELTGDFSFEEAANFILIKTDKSFKTIDSFKINFGYKPQQYALYAGNSEIPETDDIRDYFFILSNNTTNSRDTLKNIRFDEEEYSFVCNECTPGKDDIRTCNKIINPSILQNQNLINELRIVISKNNKRL